MIDRLVAIVIFLIAGLTLIDHNELWHYAQRVDIHLVMWIFGITVGFLISENRDRRRVRSLR